jgi:hypothetical protein
MAAVVLLPMACAHAPEETAEDDDDGSGGNTNSPSSHVASGMPAGNGGATVTGSVTTSSVTNSASSTDASSTASSSNSVASTAVASSTSSGGSGGLCYAGQGSCNPLTSSCISGDACDIDGSTNTFVCFPPPNTQGLNQSCDNSLGPFCQHGLACDAGICRQYCCTTGDCTGGATCQTVGMAGSIVVMICL